MWRSGPLNILSAIYLHIWKKKLYKNMLRDIFLKNPFGVVLVKGVSTAEAMCICNLWKVSIIFCIHPSQGADKHLGPCFQKSNHAKRAPCGLLVSCKHIEILLKPSINRQIIDEHLREKNHIFWNIYHLKTMCIWLCKSFSTNCKPKRMLGSKIKSHCFTILVWCCLWICWRSKPLCV